MFVICRESSHYLLRLPPSKAFRDQPWRRGMGPVRPSLPPARRSIPAWEKQLGGTKATQSMRSVILAMSYYRNKQCDTEPAVVPYPDESLQAL